MKHFFSRIPPDGVDEFALFSGSHIIVAILSLLLLYVLIRYVDRLRDSRYEKLIRIGYAISLFGTNIPIWLYAAKYNMSWHEFLPIATCGWGVILGSIALLFQELSQF